MNTSLLKNIYQQMRWVFILSLVCTQSLLASTEPYSNWLDILPPMTESQTFSVTDDKFGNADEWAKIESIHKVSNRIIFQVNEESLRMKPEQEDTYTVFLEVKRWMADGTQITSTPSLQFTYNPDAATSSVFQAFEQYEGAHRMEVKVLNITAANSMSFPEFRIYAEIIVERTYLFNCMEQPEMGRAAYPTPFLELSDQGLLSAAWFDFQGAEEYDLEWSFYDKKGLLGSAITAQNDNVLFDQETIFKNNATRITTDNNNYNIQLLYPEGYLFFRVRAVRYLSNGTREVSKWSSNYSATTAPALHAFPDFFAVAWHQEDMNWQASIMFAEDAKQKAAINFFDGSLRQRQAATHLGDKKIISQSLYDHYGRPTIQLLPSPSSETSAMSYEPTFASKDDPSGTGILPYTKDDFLLTSPSDSPSPMGEQKGPGRYYGNSIAPEAGKDNYLPDAEGYPFSMTSYTNDQTGRVLKQSGVGATFRMGNGHETRYFYGKPAQEQLDRLFGNDVGFADHYFRNMIVDPNGQASVSYIDAHGRTIATALAGDSPDAVSELELDETASTDITFDLLNNLDGTLISSYALTVEKAGDYVINYDLNNLPYQEDCLPDNVCYDCVYEVEITISDNECNAFNNGEPIVVQQQTHDLAAILSPDTDCSSPDIDINDILTGKELPIGQYNITKTLKLNTSVLDSYVIDYIEQEDCLPDFEEILEDFIGELEEIDCNQTEVECLEEIGANNEAEYLELFANELGISLDELTEELSAYASQEYNDLVAACEALSEPNDCEIYEAILLSDMTPALEVIGEDGCPVAPHIGQYAIYTLDAEGNVLPADIQSIFHPSADFYYGNEANWMPTVSIFIDGESFWAHELSANDFVEHWQDEWAQSLIHLHPEYCYYEWCLEDDSVEFDALLRSTNSYEEALNMVPPLIGTSGLIYELDPFFQAGGQGEEALDQIQDFYNNIMNDPSAESLSLLDWVSQITYGYGINGCMTYFGQGSAAENDKAWQRLRSMYLSEKERIRAALRAEECDVEIPDCEEVPPAVEISSDCFTALVETDVDIFVSLNDFIYTKSFEFDLIFDESDFQGFSITDQSALAGGLNIQAITGGRHISWVAPNNAPTDFGELLQILAFNGLLVTDFSGSSSISVQNFVYTTGDNVLRGIPNVYGSYGHCTFARTKAAEDCECTKVSRFPDPPSDFDLDLTSVLAELTAVEEALIEACENNCEALRFNWRQDLVLNNCNLDDATIELILDRMQAVCELGCDAAHPDGASSTPILASGTRELTEYNDYSFVQILNDVLLNNTVCDDCSPYIINYPAPYEEISYRSARTVVSKAGTCACDQLKMLEACYAIDDAGFTSFDDYLGRYSEVALSAEDLAMLQDACTNMSETSSYLPRPIQLPPYLDCGVCKTCDEVAPLVANFNSFNCMDNTAEDYDQKLSVYLNSRLGFNLSAEDYKLFLDDCALVGLSCKDANMICPKSNYDIPIPEENDCMAEQIQAATEQAILSYEAQLEAIKQDFIDNYLEHCNNVSETFEAAGQMKEHHYTLYYYDQAGNLIKTIPPAGVHPLANDQLAAVADYRETNTGTAVFPSHNQITTYQFNSLGQHIAKNTPDADAVYYWYDELGRLVASRDGRQAGLGRHSYTLYDELGRVREVGEASNLFSVLSINNNRVAYDLFEFAVQEIAIRKFVSKTYYNEAVLTDPTLAFGAQGQENLRNRVAAVTYSKNYNEANDIYDYATHYSYDVTGNVKTIVQDLYPLKNIGHQFKRMDYEYDFLSGNVHAVYYQRGKEDQFTHRYVYDQDNRLTQVYTSAVNTDEPLESALWDKEAIYDYYDHGPLARTDIGQHQVQGMDYAYTLQGWIKGMNSSSLTPEKDMGRDGAATSTIAGSTQNPNILVARDAFAYTLNYFEGDFSPLGGADAQIELAAADNSSFNTAPSLYNGNIRQMVSESMGLTGGVSGNNYTYDQLHRILGMDNHQIMADATNYAWGMAPTASGTSSSYSYDPNGNLKQLNRAEAGLLMDELTYNYDNVHPNRLLSIADATSENDFDYDFDGNIGNNYSYDGSGNLIADANEGSSLTWTPYGKVDQINFAASAKTTVFEYDAAQNRVSKQYVDPNNDNIITDYYVRDAQGNVMAVYQQIATSNDLEWKEQHLYGSKRIGLWRPNANLTLNANTTPYFENTAAITYGTKTYELSNHLGNVTATISDRKIAADTDEDGIADYYIPQLRSATEYYPFGLEIHTRSNNFSDYRFGFNGKEADTNKEWGELTHYDYGFRIYNPSIAKFLSVDPLSPEYPWYTPYQFAGNNPIKFIDLDGLEPAVKELFKYPITTPDDRDINIAIGATTTWVHGAVTSFEIDWWNFDGKLVFEWNSEEGAYINPTHGSYLDWANKWIEAEGSYLTFKAQEYAQGIYDLTEGIITDPIKTGEHVLTDEIEAGDLDITDVWVSPRSKKKSNSPKKKGSSSSKKTRECFKEGTKVKTLKGENNIKEIIVGDLVWSYIDFENAISLSGYTSSDSICIGCIGESNIKVFPDSLFYLKKTYVEVEGLKKEDVERDKLIFFKPMRVMVKPQDLMKVWDNEPIPVGFYTEKEKEIQKQINEKTTDGIITYSPLDKEKEWTSVDYEEITPFTWKWVDFELPRPDETVTKINLRRPNWWLKEIGADSIGKKVYLDMPELSLQGWATVTAIRINQLDTRFWDENRDGNYVNRPITGKFTHESNNVYNLHFGDNVKPLGITGSHPIWSVDRNDWVGAIDLKIGEVVKTQDGEVILKSREKLNGRHKVYNLEIYRDHNFLVSTDKILVHNNCLPSLRRVEHDTWNELKRLGIQKKVKAAMDKGLAPRRMGKGSTGIIKLTEQEMKLYPGYTHKIKIKGDGTSHHRVLGTIQQNSKGKDMLWFDKIVND